jgi:hypothetical protein
LSWRAPAGIAGLAPIGGACASDPEPTPRERAAEALRALTDEIRREARLDPTIDLDSVRDQALERLQRGAEDDREASLTATDVLLRGLRKGHTGIFIAPPLDGRDAPLACRRALPSAPERRRGVPCTGRRPPARVIRAAGQSPRRAARRSGRRDRRAPG